MDFYWTTFKLFAAITFITCPILFFITAPYGKFSRNGWGGLVSGRISWMLQESPCFFYGVYYLLNTPNLNTESYILLTIFTLHYFQRAFVYGYLMSMQSLTTLSMFLAGIIYNLVNGYLQCGGIAEYDKPEGNLYSPRFTFGICLWTCGCFMNIHCDCILRSLRAPGEHGYKVPKGGMFNFVSAGNYFSESLEWLGWAIASQNHSSWLFFVLTVANLLPRSISQHKWYLSTFKEYRSLNRKAFIPFIF